MEQDQRGKILPGPRGALGQKQKEIHPHIQKRKKGQKDSLLRPECDKKPEMPLLRGSIRRKKQSPDRRKEKSKKSHHKSHGARPVRHRGTAGKAETRLEKRLHQKPERDPGLQNLPRHRRKKKPAPPEIHPRQNDQKEKHPHLDRHKTPGRDILLLPDPCLRETEKENCHRGIQRHKKRPHHIRDSKLELLQ